MTAKFHVSESTAITQVVTRLTEAFTPAVPVPQVSETVRRIHHRFDQSKIRDFVPLLVEHAARDELRERVTAVDTAGLGRGPR